MERNALTLAGFVTALIVALVVVPLSAMLMPPLVASHFAADGAADSVMPRGAYIALMTGLTVAMPLLMVTSVGWGTRRPSAGLRLPHKDYWLAPERRAESIAWLRSHMMRFGIVLVAFLVSVHGLVVRANLLHPPRLELAPLAVCGGLFLVALLLWLRALYGRFSAPH